MLDLLARAGGPGPSQRAAAQQDRPGQAKPKLLPRIERYAETGLFEEIVPISALTGDGCERVLDILWRLLPEGPPLYDPELLTIHPERFLAAERIREKVLEATREELPFTTAVVIERWEEDAEGAGARSTPRSWSSGRGRRRSWSAARAR
jgi:GTPase Era involved in 16S rRNA processing